MGAEGETILPTRSYMMWTVTFGAAPAILNVVLAYLVRSEGAALHASNRNHERLPVKHHLGSHSFYPPLGASYGAAGAGLATFLSNCVACLYFFVLLYGKRGNTYVSIHPKNFTLKRDILSGICTVGVPAAVQNLLNVTGMTILNNFTSSYGADAVAAMGITQKINMVPMYVSMGLSQGIMPLVSYNYSSGNIKRMKRTILFAAKAAISFMVVMVAVYCLGAGSLTRMFMDNETVIAYGSRFLSRLLPGAPVPLHGFLAVGVFQAVGMGKEAFLFAILRKIVLEIPALYVLNLLFPLYGSRLCAADG